MAAVPCALASAGAGGGAHRARRQPQSRTCPSSRLWLCSASGSLLSGLCGDGIVYLTRLDPSCKSRLTRRLF
eukprot:6488561-Prymnesium_polylepis.2